MRILVDPAPLDDETLEVLVDAWTALIRAELARADASATGTDRNQQPEDDEAASAA